MRIKIKKLRHKRVCLKAPKMSKRLKAFSMPISINKEQQLKTLTSFLK